MGTDQMRATGTAIRSPREREIAPSDFLDYLAGMNSPLTKRTWAILAVSCLAAILGCTPPPGTGSASPVERYLKSGQEQARRNDFTGALAAFNKALALDLDNAAVHYELAGLYDNDLDSPEKALYHYTRVLEINPEYRWADIIKDRLPSLRMRVSSGNIPLVPCPELEKEIVDLHRSLAVKNTELQHQVDQNQDLPTPDPCPSGSRTGCPAAANDHSAFSTIHSPTRPRATRCSAGIAPPLTRNGATRPVNSHDKPPGLRTAKIHSLYHPSRRHVVLPWQTPWDRPQTDSAGKSRFGRQRYQGGSDHYYSDRVTRCGLV